MQALSVVNWANYTTVIGWQKSNAYSLPVCCSMDFTSLNKKIIYFTVHMSAWLSHFSHLFCLTFCPVGQTFFHYTYINRGENFNYLLIGVLEHESEVRVIVLWLCFLWWLYLCVYCVWMNRMSLSSGCWLASLPVFIRVYKITKFKS